MEEGEVGNCVHANSEVWRKIERETRSKQNQTGVEEGGEVGDCVHENSEV